MKKVLTIAVLALFTAIAVKAQDYTKMHIWELAGTADVVLTGTVGYAKGLNVEFNVDKAIIGEYNEGILNFKGSKGYKTFKRHGKYVEGEQLLLFLKNGESGLELMGQAGEGEKLIMGDKIYLDSRGEGVFNKFQYYKLAVADEKAREKNLDRIYAEEMVLQEFIDAVSAYPGCFSVGYEPRTNKMGEVYDAPYAEQKCDEKALDEYSFINLASRKLAEESLKAVK